MPYSPREAVTVALYNAGIEPLHEAFDFADKVLDGLKQMGFAVQDVHHSVDIAVSGNITKEFVAKAALRALPDLQ